jgi:uncharacterized membrane protein YjjP (DUF1212 family)
LPTQNERFNSLLATEHSSAPDPFEARAHFVSLLAKQLHESGTTAARLENALCNVGRKLKMEAAVWSSPTAIILSLSDLTGETTQAKNVVRVLRLNPGDVDLRTLCAVDDIAERVISGELNAQTGARALTLAGAPVSPLRAKLETIGGFVLANTGVACLLNCAWAEIAVAAVIGALLGWMHLWLGSRRRFTGGLDALCAITAAFLVTASAHLIAPLDYRRTLLASLIVLVPGLGITSAAAEIATQHLVSGTARMAGAFATLLKLAFGALVGAELAKILGMTPMLGNPVSAPEWVAWLGLLISGFSFAVLFKALPQDFPLAIGAAILGYACTRIGGAIYGAEFGVFVAGLIVALCANLYARLVKRPGALIRLPGIILLVPGSVGFKSLFFVFQKDVFLGLDTAVSLLLLLVSLVAGLLLASTLVAPRNSL